MPIILGAIYLLPAIYFAIHAVKNQQDTYWLYILFGFPLLGSLIYGLAIWLPDFRQTHRGHSIEGKIKNHLQPDKELKFGS